MHYRMLYKSRSVLYFYIIKLSKCTFQAKPESRVEKVLFLSENSWSIFNKTINICKSSAFFSSSLNKVDKQP